MKIAIDKPALSRRARNLPESAVRFLEADGLAAKARGIHIYHLNIGQPDIETPEAMRSRAAAAVERVVAYAPARGTDGAIRAMLGYYRRLGVSLKTEHLIVTTGGSEALLYAMQACADDGDSGLVVEPLYANWRHFAAITGVRLHAVRTRVEDGFHIPPREVWEAAIRPDTRFIMLCNPNNPTGTVSTPEEIAMLAELCRDRGIFLVLDEVYREFVYDGRTPWSSLMLDGFDDTIIVADSISKRYSACGMRIGMFITRNREVMDACMRISEGRLSSSMIAQRMIEGLDDLPADYAASVTAEYQRRRDVLYSGLTSIPGVELARPEGAFYFIARLPVGDAAAFSRWLLTDFQKNGATVMLSPARGFYLTPGLGTDEVRIAYVLGVAGLEPSIEILRDGIAAWNAR